MNSFYILFLFRNTAFLASSNYENKWITKRNQSLSSTIDTQKKFGISHNKTRKYTAVVKISSKEFNLKYPLFLKASKLLFIKNNFKNTKAGLSQSEEKEQIEFIIGKHLHNQGSIKSNAISHISTIQNKPDHSYGFKGSKKKKELFIMPENNFESKNVGSDIAERSSPDGQEKENENISLSLKGFKEDKDNIELRKQIQELEGKLKLDRELFDKQHEQYIEENR